MLAKTIAITASTIILVTLRGLSPRIYYSCYNNVHSNSADGFEVNAT